MRKLLLISAICFCELATVQKACAQSSIPFITWDSLSSGMGGSHYNVRAIIMHDSSFRSPIYAGGDFTISSKKACAHVTEYSQYTQKWSPLGTGTNGTVNALAMYGKKLYAAGSFDSAGGVSANYIASWDSVTWDSLGSGLNGNVYALVKYNNVLYAGGDFTMAGGVPANRIAKWNGTSWSAVGLGFDSNTVYALAVYNDTLYAGGSFITSNGVRVNHIAKWNGTKWDSLGHGTNDNIYALTGFDALYAGGAFITAGSLTVNHIARWQHYSMNKWDTLGSGTDDTVFALSPGNVMLPVVIKPHKTESTGNILLVGGKFKQVDKTSSPYIAAFNGNWFTIGQLNGAVYSLTWSPISTGSGNNYVGGMFDSCYGNTFRDTLRLNYVAQLQLGFPGGINEVSSSTSDVNVYPNPSTGVFNYELKIKNYNSINAVVYNILGEKIYSQSFSIQNATFKIDLNGQPAGIYFYRITSDRGETIADGKLIKE